MKKITLLFLATGVALSLTAGAQVKKNVILYIGDGFGVSAKTAARMSLGQGTPGKKLASDATFHVLALDKMRFNTMVTTHSANSWITDSGPGATLIDSLKGVPVNNVGVDTANNIWFVSNTNSCYCIKTNGKINTVIQAPSINAMACTVDGNVWVGTNVGLYKVSQNGTRIDRYEEEGVEGLELPDNLVERVFADINANIWVQMPESITFLPSSGFVGDAPTYNHVGSKNNEIYAIEKAPLSPLTYLFATAEGLIFTPDLKGAAQSYTGEIHEEFTEKAVLLTEEKIEQPAELKGEKVKDVCIVDKIVWFITEKGLWNMTEKKFTKILKARGK